MKTQNTNLGKYRTQTKKQKKLRNTILGRDAWLFITPCIPSRIPSIGNRLSPCRSDRKNREGRPRRRCREGGLSACEAVSEVEEGYGEDKTIDNLCAIKTDRTGPATTAGPEAGK